MHLTLLSVKLGGMKETATIGGGCFWCLEAVYLEFQGIQRVVSGYAGGHTTNPTYQAVCSETTGHAEVVQIEFDNTVISYRDVLNIFFTIHDPTTLNRQGNDIGESYRSIILTHSDAQLETAKETILAFSSIYDKPIVTQLEALKTFYPAEAYHQNYYARNQYQGYCIGVVAPKVAKARKEFTQMLLKK
jgi:peptide-methionine (S)-S-oxide reductase